MVYPREYQVSRAPVGARALEQGWDEGVWKGVPGLGLDHFLGEPPTHRPKVEARLLYDEDGVLAAFHVEDRYVLATAQSHQSSVCIDSCVELFFTPGENVAAGYFNIECNCGGTVLVHHQLSRGEQVRVPGPEVIRAMEIRHSLPTRVLPEIAEPTTWTVSYRIPARALASCAPVVPPAPGVRWRANLYKCADRSSHPHWLTWSAVDLPRPDFHRKEYFGILRFL